MVKIEKINIKLYDPPFLEQRKEGFYMCKFIYEDKINIYRKKMLLIILCGVCLIDLLVVICLKKN